jgi:hypothetical protein
MLRVSRHRIGVPAIVSIWHDVALANTDLRAPTAYVVLAYTKLGKPLYSSRIILEDLNPVFEETAASALPPS